MLTGENIPTGYLLKLTTWENDADNYATVFTADIQTTDEVNFFIEIAELFYSCHSSNDPNKRTYGNSDRSDEAPDPSNKYQRDTDYYLVDDIKKIVDEYRSKGLVIPDGWDYSTWDKSNLPKDPTWDVDLCWYCDLLSDFGIDTWADGEYWRVLENWEVFFVPSQIENVTHKFK